MKETLVINVHLKCQPKTSVTIVTIVTKLAVQVDCGGAVRSFTENEEITESVHVCIQPKGLSFLIVRKMFSISKLYKGQVAVSV